MLHRPIALLAAALVAAPAATEANDHRDGALLRLAPTDGDITGLYAWTSADRKRLDMVLGWAPDSGPMTRFSDAVQWVLRVASRPHAGAADAVERTIVCTFDVAQQISCWSGDEYLHGDGSRPSGLASASGRLRVFAGLRNDPFFLNREGFAAAAAKLGPAVAAAPRDGAGCPTLQGVQRDEIAGLLRHSAGGGAAKDGLARQNVLALVVEIDLALVSAGGPILAVSASTHKRR